MANSILGSILGDFKSRYGHLPELTLLPFGLESFDMFLFISIPSNLSKFPTPPSEEPYVNCIPSTIFYLKKKEDNKKQQHKYKTRGGCSPDPLVSPRLHVENQKNSSVEYSLSDTDHLLRTATAPYALFLYRPRQASSPNLF